MRFNREEKPLPDQCFARILEVLHLTSVPFPLTYMRNAPPFTLGQLLFLAAETQFSWNESLRGLLSGRRSVEIRAAFEVWSQFEATLDVQVNSEISTARSELGLPETVVSRTVSAPLPVHADEDASGRRRRAKVADRTDASWFHARSNWSHPLDARQGALEHVRRWRREEGE